MDGATYATGCCILAAVSREHATPQRLSTFRLLHISITIRVAVLQLSQQQVLWRREDPVLNASGAVIVGGMFKHQRRLWEARTFIKTLVGGYGSGKTFIGGKRAIAQALLNRGIPFGVVSPTYRIQQRTVVPTIKQLLDGRMTLDPYLAYKFNKTDGVFEIHHRGRVGLIWLASGDDPASLKGPNLCGAWVDEPFVQDRDVFNTILARLRHPDSRNRELVLTGTPEELNWGYDICEGDDAKNFDNTVVHASTRENIALDPQFVQMLLRAYDARMVQAFIEGKFIALGSGFVYYGFTDKNVAAIERPRGCAFEAGIDFNVNPMAAVVFWRHGLHMHIVEDIELPNADTSDMCSRLLEWNWDDGAGRQRIIDVYPDATGHSRHTSATGGKSDHQILRDHQFVVNAKSTNPIVRDRENTVNGKFAPKVGAPTLTVDPKCKKLISYLKQYQHEKKLKQKSMSHELDAMGYPVVYCYPIYRPQLTVTRLAGH